MQKQSPAHTPNHDTVEVETSAEQVEGGGEEVEESRVGVRRWRNRRGLGRRWDRRRASVRMKLTKM